MAQRCRPSPAPADDPGVIASTHVRQLTAAYNFSSRGPNALSWLSGVLYSHTHIHKTEIKKNLNK